MRISINDAIEEQDVDRVRELLVNGDSDDTRGFCDDEDDALHRNTYLVACRVGNLQIYKLLKEHFKESWLRDAHLRVYESSDGTTLTRTTHLCEALRHSNFDLARRLIELGSNVNAIWVSDDDSFDGDELRFHGINTSDSGIAWWLAPDELIPEMTQHGLQVDAFVNKQDGNAIFQAIIQGNDRAVDRLLEMGADPVQECQTGGIRTFDIDSKNVPLLVLAMHGYYNEPNEKKLRIVSLIVNRLPLQYLSEPMSVVPFDNPFFSDAESLAEFVLTNEASPIDDLFGLTKVRAEMTIGRDRNEQLACKGNELKHKDNHGNHIE